METSRCEFGLEIPNHFQVFTRPWPGSVKIFLDEFPSHIGEPMGFSAGLGTGLASVCLTIFPSHATSTLRTEESKVRLDSSCGKHRRFRRRIHRIVGLLGTAENTQIGIRWAPANLRYRLLQQCR